MKTGPIVRQVFSQISAKAWLVILTGLGLRLWVCLHTVIINPDGALYIHQAMALYFKNWNSLKTCGLSFLSSYPVLIAGGYYLIHDWILSARLISLFFGTALLVPLYLMLKEWVREDSAILGLLVFAVTPVLVSNSVELVRDPICWFFLCAGTFAVIRQATTHSPWLLLVSSLCFLAAIWARIEAVLFLAVTLGYLLCFQNNRRTINILIFLSPLLAIAFFSIAGLMISGLSFNDLHRGHEIAGKFIEPIRQYQKMAESLKDLVWSSPNPFMEFFLPEARNLIWLIALGTLLNRFLEAFFYPFVVFYIIGLSGIHRKIRSDSRLLYLAILTVSGLALLYMHTLQTWMLYYRFFGIVMIPSAILCAFGTGKAPGDTPQATVCSAGDCFLGDPSADYRCQSSKKSEIAGPGQIGIYPDRRNRFSEYPGIIRRTDRNLPSHSDMDLLLCQYSSSRSRTLPARSGELLGILSR